MCFLNTTLTLVYRCILTAEQQVGVSRVNECAGLPLFWSTTVLLFALLLEPNDCETPHPTSEPRPVHFPLDPLCWHWSRHDISSSKVNDTESSQINLLPVLRCRFYSIYTRLDLACDYLCVYQQCILACRQIIPFDSKAIALGSRLLVDASTSLFS